MQTLRPTRDAAGKAISCNVLCTLGAEEAGELKRQPFSWCFSREEADRRDSRSVQADPAAQPESPQDLAVLGVNFLWARTSGKAREEVIDGLVTDSTSVADKDEGQALEPHVSWHRQLWRIVRRYYRVHAALLVATLVGLVPLSAEAAQYYTDTWKARATAIVTLWCLALISLDGAPAGPCLFIGGTALAALGIIRTDEAYGGFSNPVIVAVASLHVVARALENSGALEHLVLPLLGTPRSIRWAQLRLMAPITVCAGFMNNTPVVAMMIPVVKGWATKVGIPESLLMMPLAYAATFGGATTLIGSGANLVGAQWALSKGLEPMGFFTLTPLGSVLAVVGMVYMALASPSLLRAEPGEGPEASDAEGRQDPLLHAGYRYSAGFLVRPAGPFNKVIGSTPKELGLVRVPGATLLDEDGRRATTPLCEGDMLVFRTNASAFVTIRQTQGLVPVAWPSITRLGAKRSHRRHFEVVLAPGSPLLQRPLDLRRFIEAFRAVPLAVHRPGQPALVVAGGSFDGFVPEVQDVYLLEGFLPGPRAGGSDFLLVHEVPDSAPPRNFTSMDLWRQRFCLAGLAAVVVATAAGQNLALCSSLLATSLLLIKALTLPEVYRFINGPLLLVIASSFGLGKAIEESGLAKELAALVLKLCRPLGGFGAVVGVYFCCALLGQFLSAITTALVVLPMVPELAGATGVPLQVFVRVVIYAANATFGTPLAAPANLMVSPHGRYSFGDFAKVGLPLQCIFLTITCSLCWIGFA